MGDRTYSRLLAGAALALAIVLSLRATGLGDYPTDAGPALSAIAHGNLAAFFSHQPAMGPLSLYLRAPFAAVAVALHDGQKGIYRWEAVPCLLAIAVVSLWLATLARRRGSGRIAQILIVGLCLLNPLVGDALYWGHPEELLTASLAVGALLAASERNSLLTGVLAGLAIASKQWALLVLVPSILVLERERLRALLAAGGVAAALILPMIVANPGAFRHALHYISAPQPVVTVFTWLYPVSPTGTVHVANIFGDARVFEAHRLLPSVGAVSRPLITILGLALPLLLWWRRGRRLTVRQMLIATALVFVARCALDPGSAAYYHFPIILILVALDVTSGRRLPSAGLVGTALAFLVLDRFPAYLTTPVANSLYIAATVIGCAVLSGRLRIETPVSRYATKLTA